MNLLSRNPFLQRISCSVANTKQNFRVCPAHLLFLLMCLLMLFATGCGNDSPDSGNESDTTASLNGDADIAGEEDGTEPDEDVGEEVSAEPDARYSLEVTPKVGDTYTYQVMRLQTESVSGTDASRRQTSDISVKLMSVNDDGSSVLGVTFNRVRVKIVASIPKPDSTGNPILDSAGQIKMFKETLDFDTQNKPKGPGGEEIMALIGREMLVTLDKEGNAVDITNTTPVVNAFLRSVKVSPDTLDPRQVKGLREQYDIQVLTEIGSIFHRAVPDSSVAVGATWTETDELPSQTGGTTKASATYTLSELREIEGQRVLRLGITLRTKADLPKESLDNELISMKIEKIDVSGEGESMFNVGTGFPVRKKSSIRKVLSGTGTAKQGPQKGKTEVIDFKEAVTTSVKQITYNPGPGQ